MDSSLLSKSKAGHDAKRGGNGGQDGDEDLEDFAPDSCFVCFHGFEKVKDERLKVNDEGWKKVKRWKVTGERWIVLVNGIGKTNGAVNR